MEGSLWSQASGNQFKTWSIVAWIDVAALPIIFSKAAFTSILDFMSVDIV